MTYVLTTPNAMRLFEPVSPNAGLLSNTGRILSAGVQKSILKVEIKSFDHRAKMVLRIDEERATYVLVNELRHAFVLANQWSFLYEETFAARTPEAKTEVEEKIKALIEELSLIVREYVQPRRPTSGTVVFDLQGPGVHPAP